MPKFIFVVTMWCSDFFLKFLSSINVYYVMYESPPGCENVSALAINAWDYGFAMLGRVKPKTSYQINTVFLLDDFGARKLVLKCTWSKIVVHLFLTDCRYMCLILSQALFFLIIHHIFHSFPRSGSIFPAYFCELEKKNCSCCSCFIVDHYFLC